MANAIDATGLTLQQIKDLRAKGIKYFGRYLSKSTWKGLSLSEKENIHNEGGEIFSIYESNPTHASYFSFAQGQADASSAGDLANSLGQPAGKPIYFTVDYDAQSRDFAAIVDYFKGVKSKIGSYKIGVYGSFATVTEIHSQGLAEYFFQTVAWSYGSKATFLNLYQAVCNTTVAGVQVDIDETYGDIGSWDQPSPKESTAEPTKVKVVSPSPAEIHENLVIHNLKGNELGTIHQYIADKNWWFNATENKDGSFDIETGIFIAGSNSFNNFVDFLKTEKFSYSTKEPSGA